MHKRRNINSSLGKPSQCLTWHKVKARGGVVRVLGFWIPAHVAQVSCTTPCGDLFTSVFSGAASGGSNPRISPSSPKGDK